MKQNRILRIMLLTLLVSMLGISKAAAEAYAVFEGNCLTFYDNFNRSSRSGVTYDLNVEYNLPGWYSDGNYWKVKYVIFDKSFANARPTSTFAWFFGMKNLQSIDQIENLNTSEVTIMSAMFYDCFEYTRSLDLKFNTEKVVDMTQMFAYCNVNFVGLDFNTSNVTAMNEMFSSCNNLKAVDISSFNTSKVKNTEYMFYSCGKLESIYVGGGWNMNSVTSDRSMFSGCESIVGGSGTTYSSNSNAAMAHVDGGSDNPGYLTLNNMYAVFDRSKTTLTFYCDNNSSSRSGIVYRVMQVFGDPYWIVDDLPIGYVYFDKSFANARPNSTAKWFYGTHISEVSLQYLNTSEVILMHSMFEGCTFLQKIDLSHFDTKNLESVWNMFTGCSRLKSVNLNNFDTRNLESMYEMFMNCSQLENLDLTSFDTSNLRETQGMFYGCSALKSIYVGDGWSMEKVNDSSGMFSGCTSLVGEQGTYYDSNHTDVGYAQVDGGKDNPGYLTLGAPYAVFDKGTLNFYFDAQRSTRLGNTYGMNIGADFPDWEGVRESVTKVVFDPSFAKARPTTTCAWFYFMINLQGIEGMEYLNTSNVTNMSDMFYNYKLPILDISGFNTSLVTNMAGMFHACYNLETIFVGEGWDTSSVTASMDMFKADTQLVGGQGTTYDASHVDKAYAHVDGGESNPGYLTLKAPYAVYNDGTLAFYYDLERKSRVGRTYDINHQGSQPEWQYDGIKKDVTKVVFDPSFANARPKATHSWFDGMTNLVSITGMAEYLNTSEALYMNDMFSACRKLESVDLSGFDTGKVTNMSGMFSLCEAMETLDLTSFNTENVKDMSNMFWGDSSLKTIDLASFNTANVTNMRQMFERCKALTTIYVGEGWNTDKVSDSFCMFRYCENLVGGMGTVYTTSHWEKGYAHVDGGTENPGYLTQRFAYIELAGNNLTFYFDGKWGQRSENLYRLDELAGHNVLLGTFKNVTDVVFDDSFAEYRPTNTVGWFLNMENLMSITGMKKNLNTSKVEDMTAMFYGCALIEDLELGGFDTRNVTSMGGMFFECSSLEKLDLSSFDTHNVESMLQMFYDCRVLEKIFVGKGWNTENVMHSGQMFDNCYSLVGGAGTYFDSDHTDACYAHIDGGIENPGYLTDGSRMLGDVNGDGKVNSADVQKIYALMAQGATGATNPEADVNVDGRVNSADIQKVYAIMATLKKIQE